MSPLNTLHYVFYTDYSVLVLASYDEVAGYSFLFFFLFLGLSVLLPIAIATELTG